MVFPWSLDQEGAIPRRQDKIANRSIGAGDLEMRIPGETPSAGETYKETRERQFNFLAAAGRVGHEAKKVLSGAGGLVRVPTLPGFNVQTRGLLKPGQLQLPKAENSS